MPQLSTSSVFVSVCPLCDFFPFLKNSFIEVWVTYTKLHVFNVYSLIPFAICLHPWQYHHRQDVDTVVILKGPCALCDFSLLPLHLSLATNGLSLQTVCFLRFYINGIMKHAFFFSLASFTQHNCFEVSSVFLHVLTAPSFSLLSSVPLRGVSPFRLSIRLWIEVWIVSSFVSSAFLAN